LKQGDVTDAYDAYDTAKEAKEKYDSAKEAKRIYKAAKKGKAGKVLNLPVSSNVKDKSSRKHDDRHDPDSDWESDEIDETPGAEVKTF
jgi:hypothetical protein